MHDVWDSHHESFAVGGALCGHTTETRIPTSIEPEKRTPLRDIISSNSHEIAVYAVGVNSQPQHSRRSDDQLNDHVHASEMRALPLARKDDIVVVSGSVDKQYAHWLRSVELGTSNVVEYPEAHKRTTLAQVIATDPTPVKAAVKATGKNAVYVPFFSGAREQEALQALGCELFGCQESIARQFFNKIDFKDFCSSLGIEVVHGTTFHLDHSGNQFALKDFEEVMSQLLQNYSKIILRDAEGAMGSSVYTFEDSRLGRMLRFPRHKLIKELYQKLLDNNENRLLIEEFKDSIQCSPNDQWAITRDGQLKHIGLSNQLFDGLHHIGNTNVTGLDPTLETQIVGVSEQIAKGMRDQGYRGVFGIDYIVVGSKFYPIENNARLNGSTFAYGIIDRLEEAIGTIPAWKFSKMYNEPMEFDRLKALLGDLLYDGTRSCGVFPFDCQL